MSKVDEKLDELLDIKSEIVEVEKQLPVIKNSTSTDEEKESDLSTLSVTLLLSSTISAIVLTKSA